MLDILSHLQKSPTSRTENEESIPSDECGEIFASICLMVINNGNLK
jgi:hypothetical protein